MRKINVHSLLIIAASIILLSSCSQVRQVTTSSNRKLHLVKADRNATAKVESPKVTEKKELKALPPKDNEISTLQEEKNSAPEVRPVISPMLDALISKGSKTDSKTEGSNKTVQNVNKVLDRLSTIQKALLPGAMAEKLMPYGHSDANRFLLLWIGAFVLAIIFFIIAFAAGTGGSAGGLFVFWFLGVLCSIAATVFFIIWLVQLFS